VFDSHTSNHDEETSFAEAYKSQILNPSDEEEETSSLPKILGIVLLVVLISGLSIFGYKYINQEETPPKPKVEEIELPQAPMMIDNIDDLEDEEPTSIEPTSEAKERPKSKNIDAIADQVKIELSKEIEKTQDKATAPKSEKRLTPTQKGEETYLEQLAELSKEIDGEK